MQVVEIGVKHQTEEGGVEGGLVERMTKLLLMMEEYEVRKVRARRTAAAVVHVAPWSVGLEMTGLSEEGETEWKQWMTEAVRTTSDLEKERILVLAIRVVVPSQRLPTTVWGTLRVSLTFKTIYCGWHGDVGMLPRMRLRVENKLNEWAITDGKRTPGEDPVWSWKFSTQSVEHRPLVEGESLLAAMWWAWRYWRNGTLGRLRQGALKVVEEWSRVAIMRDDGEYLFNGPRYSKQSATKYEPVAWQAGVVGKWSKTNSNGGNALLEQHCQKTWDEAKWAYGGPPDLVQEGTMRLLSWNVDGWSREWSELMWTLLRCGEVGAWAGQDMRWDDTVSEEERWRAMAQWGVGSMRWTVQKGQPTQAGRRIGGAALATTAQWASRHIQSIQDSRNWGRYAGQVLQGKHG